MRCGKRTLIVFTVTFSLLFLALVLAVSENPNEASPTIGILFIILLCIQVATLSIWLAMGIIALVEWIDGS